MSSKKDKSNFDNFTKGSLLLSIFDEHEDDTKECPYKEILSDITKGVIMCIIFYLLF
jgi:hypothetical protein